jgi:hypothetical protein
MAPVQVNPVASHRMNFNLAIYKILQSFSNDNLDSFRQLPPIQNYISTSKKISLAAVAACLCSAARLRLIPVECMGLRRVGWAAGHRTSRDYAYGSISSSKYFQSSMHELIQSFLLDNLDIRGCMDLHNLVYVYTSVNGQLLSLVISSN